MPILTDMSLVAFNALQSSEGIEAMIVRGNLSCSPIIVEARTDSQAVTNSETIYASNAQDVLIAVPDYAPTGTPTAPQNNDVIMYSDGINTLTLNVLPPGQNQQCFTRWKGNHVYRVHCKVTNRVPL